MSTHTTPILYPDGDNWCEQDEEGFTVNWACMDAMLKQWPQLKKDDVIVLHISDNLHSSDELPAETFKMHSMQWDMHDGAKTDPWWGYLVPSHDWRPEFNDEDDMVNSYELMATYGPLEKFMADHFHVGMAYLWIEKVEAEEE